MILCLLQAAQLTVFHQEHPGGPQAILQYAGKDATEPFEKFHTTDALKNLPAEKHLGLLTKEATAALTHAQRSKPKTKDQLRVEEAHKQKPPLHRILSLAEMEVGNGQQQLQH